MYAFRALRWRVVPLAIVALLLHASAPSLHVHAKHTAGDGAEWTEVCTGTGQTVLVRVDAATGEAVTVDGTALSSGHSGDHPCPQCLSAGTALPASSGPDHVAVVATGSFDGAHSAPDRSLLWSAQRSRAPPSAP